MASILKVDELRGIVSAGDITVTSEGGAATQSLQQGLAKAFACLRGGNTNSFGLNQSFNVASATDHGTGDYSINFINNFNYNEISTTALAQNQGSGNRLYASMNANGAASAARVATFNESGSTFDCDQVNFAVHGDLA